MYDYKELCSKIVILVVLQSMVHYYPDLKKYNNETRFNYYRSLMCLVFTCLGLHVGIHHFKNGFSHPFSYHHNEMNEIHYIFMAYLIVDMLKLLANNTKRPDLYIHHILCIGSIILGLTIGKYGYLHSILLVCESISIITGVDSMAMEENDDYLSYKCKVFRKKIINYIRLPMWISLLIFTLKYTNRAPSLLWYNGIITSIGMIILDKYWEGKCDKVIAKYE
jgi:hypothetical protein